MRTPECPAEFGVKVTMVQPGGCWTDLYASAAAAGLETSSGWERTSRAAETAILAPTTRPS
ncbi:hypothetical protein ACWGE0_13020 [Lentzea sp. NPDC054927]